MNAKNAHALRPLRRLIVAQVLGVYVAATMLPFSAYAAPTVPPASLAQVPQFLQFPPAPNVFITLDNSGSMALEYLPLGDDQNRPRLFPHPFGKPYNASGDGDPSLTIDNPPFVRFEHTLSVARARSASHNLMYYNPRVRYRPWKYADAAGNILTYPEAADPPADTFALYHPLFPARGGLDLAGSTATSGSSTYTARLIENDSNSPTVPFALYYNFDTTRPGCDPVDPANDLDCYERVEIKPSVTTYVIPPGNQRGQPDEPGCAAVSGQMRCNYAAEFKNFANWFQYYRSRTLMARGAMGNALADLGPGFRVGFGLLNPTSNSTGPADGFSSTTVRIGVRPFEGANRKPIYDLLHNHDVASATPSARALFEVGQYFDWKSGSNPSATGPWSNDPAAGANEFAACRQSYHVYVTDGYWNECHVFDSNLKRCTQRFSSAIPSAVDAADTTEGPQICRPSGTPVPAGQPACYQYKPNAVGEISGPNFAAFGAPGPNNLGNPNNRRFVSTENQSLADIAMYYWYRDLQPAMPNIVAPSTANPAFWQNLSLMAVSLGLVGTKTHLGDTFLNALDNGTDSWPTGLNPDGGDSKTIDDLWHAAVNSRGRMLMANNPQEFAAQLAAALQEIRARAAVGAAAAASTAFLDSGNGVFTAEISQGTWTGNLYRREIDPSTLAFRATRADGTPLPRDSNDQPYLWRASDMLPAPNARRIFTMRNGASARSPVVEFTATGLDAAQLADLDTPQGAAADVIEYLRGNRSKELSAVPPGNFRDRPRARPAVAGSLNNVLGTIANAAPIFVKDLDWSYDFLPASTASAKTGRETYLAYLRANQGNSANPGRAGTLWTGSNGGMFHAFDADTGVEKFAYVPRSVIRNLGLLVDPKYTHRYLVDGVPAQGDAYFGSSCPNVVGGVDRCWRTVVVSSLGAGGRAVFAIDATDPNALNETSVLWDLDEQSLSSGDYQKLGHVLGPAIIARVKDDTRPSGGRWVAVFGNGPESDEKTAALFVVDVETGSVVRVLDTRNGNASNPNGLSTPAPLFDANRQLIAVYAGDLRGNLWKFDLGGSNPSAWSVAFDRNPLFTTRSPANVGPAATRDRPQPILAKPLLRLHPDGGVMVLFGTGKLISPGDRESEDVQTFYGIWDKPGESSGLSGNFRGSGSPLVQQAITAKSGDPLMYFMTDFDVSYAAGKRGWFFDLGVVYSASGDATLVTPRERLIAAPVAFGQNLLAQTFVPSVDSCDLAGLSFMFRLNFLTGRFVGTGSFGTAQSAAIAMPGSFGLLPFIERLAQGGDPRNRTGVVFGIGLGGELSGRRMELGGFGAFRTWRQLLD
jgi:type IV pilus assembly protein PilY1